jgi:hypothetical protein
MLGTSVRILAAIAMAASLAAPVGAKSLRNAPLDPKLIELRGEVLSVYRTPGRDWGTTISLLTRNSNFKGAPQNGFDAEWSITVDSDLLKAAGVTQAMLLKQEKITILGYSLDHPDCYSPWRSCAFAGRQIRFDNGCTVFVGKAAPVFGPKGFRYGLNVPEDGLEAAGQPKCFEDRSPSVGRVAG